MTKHQVSRVVFSAVAGVASVAALIAVMLAVAETGGTRVLDLGGFSWVVPVVAGSMVGVLAWLLLTRAREVIAEPPETPDPDCPSCGRGVLEDWRLCPYCGSFIEGGTRRSSRR